MSIRMWVTPENRHVTFYEIDRGGINGAAPRLHFIVHVNAVPLEHIEKGSFLPRMTYLSKTWERHCQDSRFNRERDYLLISNFGVSDVFRFKPSRLQYPVRQIKQIS